MAAGTRAAWAGATHLPQGLIYPDLVHSGMVETLVQNTDAFNAQSRNAIRLVSARRRGDYSQESFFGAISSLVSRRLVANSPDNPAVTPSQLPLNEHISIKLNRRIGPVDQTLDSFRKLGMNANLDVLSFTLGQQIAKAVQIDQLDAGLRSVVAALQGQSATNKVDVNAASPHLLTTPDLVDGLAKMGDQANRIAIWVMHSKAFYDLVKHQIAQKIDGVSDFNIFNGTPVTLNRPVLVTDSDALKGIEGSPQTTTYLTLGLTADAVILEDSEEELIYTDVVTGSENLVVRVQGEFAYNVKVKGFKWDVTNGSVNPSNTALATTTNWDKAVTSYKDLAGVVLESY